MTLGELYSYLIVANYFLETIDPVRLIIGSFLITLLIFRFFHKRKAPKEKLSDAFIDHDFEPYAEPRVLESWELVKQAREILFSINDCWKRSQVEDRLNKAESALRKARQVLSKAHPH